MALSWIFSCRKLRIFTWWPVPEIYAGPRTWWDHFVVAVFSPCSPVTVSLISVNNKLIFHIDEARKLRGIPHLPSLSFGFTLCNLGFAHDSSYLLPSPLLKSTNTLVSNSLGPHGLYPSRLSVHGILQARILEQLISYTAPKASSKY